MIRKPRRPLNPAKTRRSRRKANRSTTANAADVVAASRRDEPDVSSPQIRSTVDGPNGCDDDDFDDLDALPFDPNAPDPLGDFGLDDEEAVPEESDFWFDDSDRFDD